MPPEKSQLSQFDLYGIPTTPLEDRFIRLDSHYQLQAISQSSKALVKLLGETAAVRRQDIAVNLQSAPDPGGQSYLSQFTWLGDLLREGTETLSYQLDGIQEGLDELNYSIDELSYSVEQGFAELAAALYLQNEKLDEIAGILSRPLATVIAEKVRNAREQLRIGVRRDKDLARFRTSDYQAALRLYVEVTEDSMGSLHYLAWFERGWLEWKLNKNHKQAEHCFAMAGQISSGKGNYAFYEQCLVHQAYMLYVQKQVSPALDLLQEYEKEHKVVNPLVYYELSVYGYQEDSEKHPWGFQRLTKAPDGHMVKAIRMAPTLLTDALSDSRLKPRKTRVLKVIDAMTKRQKEACHPLMLEWASALFCSCELIEGGIDVPDYPKWLKQFNTLIHAYHGFNYLRLLRLEKLAIKGTENIRQGSIAAAQTYHQSLEVAIQNVGIPAENIDLSLEAISRQAERTQFLYALTSTLQKARSQDFVNNSVPIVKEAVATYLVAMNNNFRAAKAAKAALDEQREREEREAALARERLQETLRVETEKTKELLDNAYILSAWVSKTNRFWLIQPIESTRKTSAALRKTEEVLDSQISRLQQAYSNKYASLMNSARKELLQTFAQALEDAGSLLASIPRFSIWGMGNSSVSENRESLRRGIQKSSEALEKMKD